MPFFTEARIRKLLDPEAYEGGMTVGQAFPWA